MPSAIAAPSASALFAAHLPYAGAVSRSLVRRLPSAVSAAEVLCTCLEGLLDAARRFRPECGVPFKTYCYRRMVGATTDYLRAIDPLTRMERAEADAGGPRAIRFLPVTTRREWGGREPLDRRTLHGEAEAAVDVRDLIDRLLAELPERDAEIVRLYFLHGLTLRAAGRRVGLSESSVSKIIIRSLRQMRAAAAEMGVE